MVIDVDKSTGAKFPRYLIYDAVRIHGRDVSYDNYQLRFDRIYVSCKTVVRKYYIRIHLRMALTGSSGF